MDAIAHAIEHNRQQAQQPVSRTEATEEAAAELYAAHKTRRYDVLENKYGISIPKAQRAGLSGYFARLQQKLHGIVNRALGKQAPAFTDGQVFQLLSRLDRAKEVGFRQPENQFTAETADVRFDLYEGDKTRFARAIDGIYSGKFEAKHHRWIKMGTTPDVLQMIGLPNTNIFIRETTIEKAFRNQLDFTRHGHNITPEMLKRFPEQMNNPIAVMHASKNSDNPNSMLVLTELTETEFLSEQEIERGIEPKEKPVIAAFIVNQTFDGMEVINITSIHGRSFNNVNSG